MKKLFPTLILVAVAAVMLSSCSQISTLSLTKRHYRSGYYVDFGGKRQNKIAENKVQPPTMPVAANALPSSQINTINTEQSQLTVLPVAVNVKPIKKAAHSARRLPSENTHSVSANNNPANVATIAQTADNELSVQSAKSATSSNSADVPMWALIIITILIAPLGVYLAKGIGTPFWIDLILYICFIIPGLIYGLIVVLS